MLFEWFLVMSAMFCGWTLAMAVAAFIGTRKSVIKKVFKWTNEMTSIMMEVEDEE